MVIKEIIGEVLLDPLHKLKGSQGNSLYQISQNNTIVVFVRHFGCIFCRETLKYIRKHYDSIQSQGFSVAIVHQSDEVFGSHYLHKFGLGEIEHFSDPDLHLYKAFGLKKGNLKQLIGLNVWKSGVRAVLRSKVFMGRVKGDAYQLGGFFLLYQGKLLSSYICKNASDIPSLSALLSGSKDESRLMNSVG
jgi:hypothetical protein